MPEDEAVARASEYAFTHRCSIDLEAAFLAGWRARAALSANVEAAARRLANGDGHHSLGTHFACYACGKAWPCPTVVLRSTIAELDKEVEGGE